MQLLSSLMVLRKLASAQVPTTLLAGSVFALFRKPLTAFRPFGPRDSESVMNFGSLGMLRCVCGKDQSPEAKADRRHFCRSCGCEVVVQDGAGFDKVLSRTEISALTRSLRSAAIRASHLELPPSVTTLEQLQSYLGSDLPKYSKGAWDESAGVQSAQVESQQVH